MAIDAIEFGKKAQAGTLTVEEAISYALTYGNPSENARKRIKALRSGFKNMGLDINMPYSDLKNTENLGLFNRELSPDKSNRFYNLQALETTLDPVMTKYNLRTILEPAEDGLEQLRYPLLAGDEGLAKKVGLGGTQRTGLAQERPMQGLLPKADLDAIYNTNLPKIAEEFGQPVADLMLYHKSTANRPTQLVNLKKSEVRITDKEVTIKGKKPPPGSKDKKFRPELTFSVDSPEGRAIINSYNTSTTDMLFNVTESELDAAFNKYISPNLEPFSDVLPLADVKVIGPDGSVTIIQKPVTTKSVIRSIVPKYLLDEFNVPAEIVEGAMGHKDTSILARSYAGSRPTKDIPLLLSDPTQFSSTGFAGSGLAGFNIYSAMSEEQRAALGDQEFKKLMAASTVEEAEKYAQLANIDPEAVKQGIAVETEIEIFRAQQEAEAIAAKTEARRAAMEAAKNKPAASLKSRISPETAAFLKRIGVDTAKAVPFLGLGFVGADYAEAKEQGLSDIEAAGKIALQETVLAPVDIAKTAMDVGEAVIKSAGPPIQRSIEAAEEQAGESFLSGLTRGLTGDGLGLNIFNSGGFVTKN